MTKQKRSADRPLVIYHGDCLDGLAAAYVAWRVYGETADYVPYFFDRTNAPLPALKGRRVFVLDYGFSAEETLEIIHCAAALVWLDHHKSSIEAWCGEVPPDGRHVRLTDKAEICLDKHKSGALLAWAYFYGTEPPRLFSLIDDYDRWQFKIPDSKAINEALYAKLPMTIEAFAEWVNRLALHNPGQNDAWAELISEGDAIMRHAAHQVAEIKRLGTQSCSITYGRGRNKKTVTGLMANAPYSLANDLGHVLAKESGTFGLSWFVQAEGRVKCSFRAMPGYDLTPMLHALNGGGHETAGGCTISMKEFMRWMATSEKRNG